MDRSKLMQYGTVVLILIFAIEILAFLFTQDPYSGSVPSPSPSSTPIPVPFEGLNSTSAYVLGFGRELLVLCNTTSDPTPLLANVSGIQAASFDPQAIRIGISLTENASAQEVLRSTTLALSPVCTPFPYKRAYINVGEMLNFSSFDGSTSKLLFGASFQCLQGITFTQCYAFVQPETQENSTVQVTLYVRTLGDEVQLLTAEEPAIPKLPETKVLEAQSRILLLFDSAVASANLPWEDRNSLNEEKVAVLLNNTINLTKIEYVPQNEIMLLNVSENATIDLIKNLSFVKSVFPLEDRLIVQPFENFTDREEAIAALLALGINSSQIDFPDSEMSLEYVIDEGSIGKIEKVLAPFEVTERQKVLADLLDVQKVESDLGARLTYTTFEILAPNPKLNATVLLELNAFVQDGKLLFISAQQAQKD